MYINKIFEQLPKGIPESLDMSVFSGEKIAILKAKNVFSSELGLNTYKFLISYNDSYPIEIVEKKKFKLDNYKIFPINPDQPHFTEKECEVDWFTPLFIDIDFFRGISKQVTGKSNLYFVNNNYKPSLYLSNLLKTFVEESKNKQKGYNLILETLSTQIVIQLIREIDNNYIEKLGFKEYNDNKCVKKVIEYLRENYTRDMTLEELSKVANYSLFYLINLFKKETGKTPFQYLTDIKIQKAKEELRYTDNSINQICFNSGFNNRSHFSSTFKKITGISPNEYRNQFK